ncbi:MAG TPA: hypothetical protein VGL05_21365 [Kribbella sp.]
MKTPKWLSTSSGEQPEAGSRDDQAGDKAISLMNAHNAVLPKLDERAKAGDSTAAKAAKNIREKGGRSDGARNDGRS